MGPITGGDRPAGGKKREFRPTLAGRARRCTQREKAKQPKPAGLARDRGTPGSKQGRRSQADKTHGGSRQKRSMLRRTDAGSARHQNGSAGAIPAPPINNCQKKGWRTRRRRRHDRNTRSTRRSRNAASSRTIRATRIFATTFLMNDWPVRIRRQRSRRIRAAAQTAGRPRRSRCRRATRRFYRTGLRRRNESRSRSCP